MATTEENFFQNLVSDVKVAFNKFFQTILSDYDTSLNAKADLTQADTENIQNDFESDQQQFNQQKSTVEGRLNEKDMKPQAATDQPVADGVPPEVSVVGTTSQAAAVQPAGVSEASGYIEQGVKDIQSSSSQAAAVSEPQAATTKRAPTPKSKSISATQTYSNGDTATEKLSSDGLSVVVDNSSDKDILKVDVTNSSAGTTVVDKKGTTVITPSSNVTFVNNTSTQGGVQVNNIPSSVGVSVNGGPKVVLDIYLPSSVTLDGSKR